MTLPLALLLLLPGRRPRFPALLGMSVVCEVALVSAGWLAARALKGFAAVAVAAMAGETDAEVTRVSGDLSRTVAVLEGIATALAIPCSASSRGSPPAPAARGREP